MEGGFPEVLGLDRRTQVQILQEYLDVLLLRDVIERHNASSPVTVKRFLAQLLTKFGSAFTVNRCVELLKAQGLGTSKTNLSEMIEWFSDAYAVFPVKMFSESVQKQNTNPKKIYAIDNGLANAVITGRSGNEGRLLENLVFLTLRAKDRTAISITAAVTIETMKSFFTKGLQSSVLAARGTRQLGPVNWLQHLQ
jgi:hypothetical protein